MNPGCRPAALMVAALILRILISHLPVRSLARPLLPRQRTTSLVVDDTGLEKIALLLQIDHLAHPRERVFLVREELREADLQRPPVGDVAQIALEHGRVHAE